MERLVINLHGKGGIIFRINANDCILQSAKIWNINLRKTKKLQSTNVIFIEQQAALHQSINQSINRSISKTIDQSINQSRSKSIDRSINQCFDQLAAQPFSMPQLTTNLTHPRLTFFSIFSLDCKIN